MSDRDSAPTGQIWMMVGFGTAMLAGKMMFDTAVRVHRAGRPARLLMGAAPFAMAGWMLSQMGGRASAPVLLEKAPAPESKRSLEAIEAEVVTDPAPVRAVAETTLESFAQVFAPLAAEADSMLEFAPDAVAEAEAEAEETPDEFVAEIIAEPAEPAAEALAEAEPAEPVVEPLVEVEPAAPVVEAQVEVEPAETVVEIPAEAEPVVEFLAEPELAAAPIERPTALAAARAEGADDLKRIKGIGAKLELLLNGHGYYHFDQIAAWGEAELAWVDANLQGFTGRATRDDWIGQARQLAQAVPEGERLI